MQGFLNFCEDYKPEFICDDRAVYSIYFGGGYAGTADFFGTVLVPEGDKNFPKAAHGRRVLILPDWKTSSALWPEYDLQIAAYVNAFVEMDLYKEFFTEYLFFGVLLRIGSRHKRGYELKVLDTETLNYKYKVFLACQTVANDQEPEFEPEIKQIPYQLSYKMKVSKITQRVAPPLTEITPAEFLKEIGGNKEEVKEMEKISNIVKKRRGRPRKVNKDKSIKEIDKLSESN